MIFSSIKIRVDFGEFQPYPFPSKRPKDFVFKKWFYSINFDDFFLYFPYKILFVQYANMATALYVSCCFKDIMSLMYIVRFSVDKIIEKQVILVKSTSVQLLSYIFIGIHTRKFVTKTKMSKIQSLPVVVHNRHSVIREIFTQCLSCISDGFFLSRSCFLDSCLSH